MHLDEVFYPKDDEMTSLGYIYNPNTEEENRAIMNNTLSENWLLNLST